eukprot:Opistho-2@60759
MYAGSGGLPLSRILFNKYDADKSGSITAKELKQLCYDKGHFLTDSELSLAISTIDVSGNGTISYDEFQKWWQDSNRFAKLKLSEADEAQLQSAAAYFKYFDKDHSGSIDSKSEFPALYADLVKNGFALPALDKCIAALDGNGDGSVSFNEYVDWLVRIGSIKFSGSSS